MQGNIVYGIHERKGKGKEGFRKGGMQNAGGTGQEECRRVGCKTDGNRTGGSRKGGMQERKYEGKEGCRK